MIFIKLGLHLVALRTDKTMVACVVGCGEDLHSRSGCAWWKWWNLSSRSGWQWWMWWISSTASGIACAWPCWTAWPSSGFRAVAWWSIRTSSGSKHARWTSWPSSGSAGSWWTLCTRSGFLHWWWWHVTTSTRSSRLLSPSGSWCGGRWKWRRNAAGSPGERRAPPWTRKIFHLIPARYSLGTGCTWSSLPWKTSVVGDYADGGTGFYEDWKCSTPLPTNPNGSTSSRGAQRTSVSEDWAAGDPDAAESHSGSWAAGLGDGQSLVFNGKFCTGCWSDSSLVEPVKNKSSCSISPRFPRPPTSGTWQLLSETGVGILAGRWKSTQRFRMEFFFWRPWMLRNNSWVL